LILRKKTLEATREIDGAEHVQKRTILVADDDSAVISHLKNALQSADYEFLEASNGSEVLTALRKKTPDLILMDVEMPGLGGVEVCRIIKANQGAGFGFIPVILMTARRGSGKVEGLELGADDYLIKPIDVTELSARVKSMLRLKALQDALVQKNKELDRANRELEEKRSELERISRTDGLTGLVNRRYFDERFKEEISRASRYQSPLSCFLLDVDHFKKVNDTYGHPFGDVVLKEVAQVLQRTLRETDIVARYGGEEFIALMPEIPREEAWRAAERTRLAVEAMRLTYFPTPPVESRTKTSALPPGPVRCTASFGLATWPFDAGMTAEQLIQMADNCLYEAKRSGRNRVIQFE
jgi:two-component system, cell cycle response regulator